MLENLEEAEVQTTEGPSKPSASASPPDRGRTTSSSGPTTSSTATSSRTSTRRASTREDVRINKAYYLCRMAEACFELALERREADDKDHYANKRLKVSGDLMRDLFRTALNKLARAT